MSEIITVWIKRKSRLTTSTSATVDLFTCWSTAMYKLQHKLLTYRVDIKLVWRKEKKNSQFTLLSFRLCFIRKSRCLTTVPSSCLTSKSAPYPCAIHANIKVGKWRLITQYVLNLILFRSSVGFNSTVDEQGHWLKEEKKKASLLMPSCHVSYFIVWCLSHNYYFPLWGIKGVNAKCC